MLLSDVRMRHSSRDNCMKLAVISIFIYISFSCFMHVPATFLFTGGYDHDGCSETSRVWCFLAPNTVSAYFKHSLYTYIPVMYRSWPTSSIIPMRRHAVIIVKYGGCLNLSKLLCHLFHESWRCGKFVIMFNVVGF